jgi:hypothetical protein
MGAPDVATVDELAERVGGIRKARALLRALDVPVVEGAFSQRLLMARLEHRPHMEADAVDRASAALARHDLLVVRAQRGHPTVLTLTVRDGAVQIGQPEFTGEDGPFAPLVIQPGEHVEAVLHIASRRTSNGTAAFGVSGLDSQGGPPLYVMYLEDEDRLWVALRSELLEFDRVLAAGTRVRGFARSPRPGALRVSMPRTENRFDVERALRPTAVEI